MRVLFAIAGFLSLIPMGAFEGSGYTEIIGLVLGLGLIAYSYFTARADATSQAAP